MRSEKDDPRKSPKSNGDAESERPVRNLGDALRQAYDETLHEVVPDDLLDLLKKLD